MRTYSLQEARKNTCKIDGWLTDGEGEFLYNTARKIPKSGKIVEIGSWKGKSTVWLGFGSKAGNHARIYAIDPHTELGKEKNRSRTFDDFKRNIKAADVEDVIVPVVKTSEDACRNWRGGKIAFLWIDGGHDYDSVEKDFLLWSPHLTEGGTIAFHDTTAKGPKLVVEKYIFNSDTFGNAGFVDSLVFAEKVGQNSFVDRLRNKHVMLVKNLYDFFAELKLPLFMRHFGKVILRAIR